MSKWIWCLLVCLAANVQYSTAADSTTILTFHFGNNQRVELRANEIAAATFEYSAGEGDAGRRGVQGERQTRGPDYMVIQMRSGQMHRIPLSGSSGAARNPRIESRTADVPEPPSVTLTVPPRPGGGAKSSPASGSAPAGSSGIRRSQDWALSMPAQNAHYRYRFVWTGDSFTGTYVGINNKSVFNGRAYTNGAQTFIEYTQTSGSYRADYKLQQTAPGKFTGTVTDHTGTFRVELTEVK